MRDSGVNQRKLAGEGRINFTGINSTSTVTGGSGRRDSDPNVTPNFSFLKTAGDTMVGPIAYFATAITISSGVIDIDSDTTSNASSYIIINGEGSTDDTLHTISNPSHLGQILILQPNATTTLTLSETGGNLSLPGGTDIVVNREETITLMFDNTVADGGNNWVVLSVGEGSSALSFPITPTINDHGNVGTVTEDIDLSLVTGHVQKLTLTGNPTLTFSNPPASGIQMTFEIEFVQDATGNRTVTHPASVSETVTISSTASTTTIVTYRTNDGGTTYHAIPALRGSININSNFLPLAGGTMTGDINMGTNDLTNVLSLGMLGDIGMAGNDIDMVAGTIKNFLGWTNAVGQTFVSDANGSTWSLPAGDAYLMNIAGAPELTVNASTVDVHDKAINSYIGWVGAVGQALTVDGTGATFDLPTGDQYIFSINALDEFIITSVGVSILNSATFQDTSADPSAPGEIQLNGADLKVFSGGSVRNLSTGSIPFDDNQDIIQDNVDNTKKLQFSLASFATATTSIIGSNTLTAGRTWSFPDATGVVPLISLAQSWTATQTFQDDSIQISNPADTFQYLIQAGAIAADRTLNLPVITGADTLAVLGLAQTFTTLQTFSSGIDLAAADLTLGTNQLIGTDTGGIRYQVPTADVHDFQVNSVTSASISSSQLTLLDGLDIAIGTTTGTKIGTGTTQKIGFFNATPVVQRTTYTVTNGQTDRAYDANATSVEELADVIATLIVDFKSLGLIAT